MPKLQLLFIASAVVFVVLLFSLPRVVVENENSDDTIGLEDTSSSSVIEEVHQNNLSDTQKEELVKYRSDFYAASTQPSKLEAYKALEMVFQQNFLYDSAAFYAEVLADEYPTIEHKQLAGERYYDAFSFATSAETSSKLGEKVRFYLLPLLEANPKQLELKTKVGMTYMTTQQPMQGIKMLQEVIEADPENEQALYNLGLLAIQTGQFQRALPRFQLLSEIAPENLQARFYLGVCYHETGDTAKAQESFEYILSATNDPEIRKMVTQYQQSL